MTREEQKAKESKKHYGDDFNCYYAFLHGAEWADEHPINVWHDASEEPQGRYEILWQDIFEYTDRTDYTEVDTRYAGKWGECVDHEGIVRWAYIKDLLPKGGEK